MSADPQGSLFTLARPAAPEPSPPPRAPEPGVTAYANPKTVHGTDEWAEDNILYTYNTLKVAAADCKTVAIKMPFFREYAKRHGKDWSVFCRESFDADPAWISKIEEGVAILLAKGAAPKNAETTAPRKPVARIPCAGCGILVALPLDGRDHRIPCPCGATTTAGGRVGGVR